MMVLLRALSTAWLRGSRRRAPMIPGGLVHPIGVAPRFSFQEFATFSACRGSACASRGWLLRAWCLLQATRNHVVILHGKMTAWLQPAGIGGF
jgi:hypothetical protein